VSEDLESVNNWGRVHLLPLASFQLAFWKHSESNGSNLDLLKDAKEMYLQCLESCTLMPLAWHNLKLVLQSLEKLKKGLSPRDATLKNISEHAAYTLWPTLKTSQAANFPIHSILHPLFANDSFPVTHALPLAAPSQQERRTAEVIGDLMREKLEFFYKELYANFELNPDTACETFLTHKNCALALENRRTFWKRIAAADDPLAFVGLALSLRWERNVDGFMSQHVRLPRSWGTLDAKGLLIQATRFPDPPADAFCWLSVFVGPPLLNIFRLRTPPAKSLTLSEKEKHLGAYDLLKVGFKLATNPRLPSILALYQLKLDGQSWMMVQGEEHNRERLLSIALGDAPPEPTPRKVMEPTTSSDDLSDGDDTDRSSESDSDFGGGALPKRL
jgi:hypothetical protein